MGERKREGENWDSQGAGKWKEYEKNTQHCIIFCNSPVSSSQRLLNKNGEDTFLQS